MLIVSKFKKYIATAILTSLLPFTSYAGEDSSKQVKAQSSPSNTCSQCEKLTNPAEQIIPTFPYPLGKTRLDPLAKPAYRLEQKNIRYLKYQGYYSIYDVGVNTPLLTVEHLGKDLNTIIIPGASATPGNSDSSHSQAGDNDLESTEDSVATKYSRPKHLSFQSDERLSALERIDHDDYRDDSHHFSRGHLTPSGDFDDRNLQVQTFMTTNIAPQVQESFNNGLWSRLEDRVRNLSKQNPDRGFTVITGVVHTDQEHAIKLNGKVSIPEYFYKIIISESTSPLKPRSVTAFLMKNREYKPGEMNICNYIVKISTIESLTGITFLTSIPDDQRKSLIKAVGNLDNSCHPSQIH